MIFEHSLATFHVNGISKLETLRSLYHQCFDCGVLHRIVTRFNKSFFQNEMDSPAWKNLSDFRSTEGFTGDRVEHRKSYRET